jgi:hypothetical protein
MFGRAILVLLAMALLLPTQSGAQIADPARPPPPAKPVDAVDALAAWRKLDISRRALKDQLELCDDDAMRFGRVGLGLKPNERAEVTEWTEWGVLLRGTGLELQTCLRAYRKQLGLLRADARTLRDMMPAVKDAKRMTLGPKQLAELTKANDDAEREIVEAEQKIAELIEGADKILADSQRALRQAGVSKVEPLAPFRSLL